MIHNNFSDIKNQLEFNKYYYFLNFINEDFIYTTALQAQKLSSFIDPFLPENMEKKFVKRESKRKYNQDE